MALHTKRHGGPRNWEKNLQGALEFARDNEANSLRNLYELLSIPSVSTSREHEHDLVRCAEWLANHLRSIGTQRSILMATGGHPVVYAEWLGKPAAPTLLIYGHYDVQPAEPLEKWTSPPFQPTVREGRLYARGATDDKGQLFIHLRAVEAYLRTSGELPLNLKIIIEGEEESGSAHLEEFVANNRKLLMADAVCISDTAFFAKNVPSICYRMRGHVYMQIEIRTANKDLHSGAFGGSVRNPIQLLAEMIAQLHDQDSRVTIPGFYDKVATLREEERSMLRELPWNDEDYARNLGVASLFGERGFTTLERLWVRPTLECCGIWGGYAGEGVKTVLPAKAGAKISMRIVPDQDANRVAELFQAHIRTIAPKGIEVTTRCLALSEPGMTPVQGPVMRAGLIALERGFGKKPLLQGEGGTLPMIALLKRILGIDTVLLGFGRPDENAHAPDEFLDLELFSRGTPAVIHFYDILARELTGGRTSEQRKLAVT